jgi:hypothetical protein
MALKIAAFLTLALTPILPAAPCRAGLVPITFDNNAPALQGFSGTLTYNASTGDFNASSTDPNSVVLTSNTYGDSFFDPSLPFSLTFDAHINPADGQLVAGGMGFQLNGAIDIDGDGIDDPPGTTTSQSLLTGTIFAFGTNGPAPPTVTFNGLFDVTGGLLTKPVALTGGGTAAPFFQVGATEGFTLSAENVTSGILGNFTQNFSSSTVKPFVQATVPEPSSLVLALIEVAALCGFADLRRRSATSRP